ncbi:MAG: hypothetical protein JWO36_1757 [Myxococcales bacterium]|nr:hypothetical protein [Myxococcales bacterium]
MEISIQKELAALTDRREPWVHALAFDPAGAHLAIAVPGRVFVHDLRTGARRSAHRIVLHANNPKLGMPREVALGAGGRDLVVAVSVPDEHGLARDNRRTVQLFRASDVEPHTVLPQGPAGALATAWALGADGTRLLVATDRGQVSVMDLATMTVGSSLQVPDECWQPGHVAAVALGHDGARIGIGAISSAEDDPESGDQYEMWLCAYSDGEPLRSFRQERTSYVDFLQLAFSADDARLVVAGEMPSCGVGTLPLKGKGPFACVKARAGSSAPLWLDTMASAWRGLERKTQRRAPCSAGSRCRRSAARARLARRASPRRKHGRSAPTLSVSHTPQTTG